MTCENIVLLSSTILAQELLVNDYEPSLEYKIITKEATFGQQEEDLKHFLNTGLQRIKLPEKTHRIIDLVQLNNALKFTTKKIYCFLQII